MQIEQINLIGFDHGRVKKRIKTYSKNYIFAKQVYIMTIPNPVNDIPTISQKLTKLRMATFTAAKGDRSKARSSYLSHYL